MKTSTATTSAGRSEMHTITRARYGGPDVLEYEQVARPTPEAGEVRIDVRFAALNAADWHLMRGSPFFIRFLYGGLRRPDDGLGSDVAGIVDAVGEAVTAFEPGDVVAADLSEHGFGGFAEAVCVPADAVVPVPDGVSLGDAAAVPTAGLTALQALRDDGCVDAGQSVLVHGASGGVGSFAVQIAKWMGATVTGVCSTGKVETVRALGADHVVDYEREDVTRGDRRFDLIVDAAATHPIRAYRRILRPGGRYVLVGAPARRFLTAAFVGPIVSRLRDVHVTTFEMHVSTADLATLLGLVADGTITPVIDRTYPLREAATAIDYLESGAVRGKVLLSTAPETD